MGSINFKFNRGDEVFDNVTGFRGIVTCQSIYFTGCARYMVQPQKLMEGKIQEPEHFDENQLTLVKAAKVETPTPAEMIMSGKADLGGPQRIPKNLPNPR